MDQPRQSSSQESGLEDITTAELVRAFIADALLDLHVALPCQVVSYDVSAQTVTVTPAQNRMVPDGAGNFISEPLPQLSDIPVGFYSGGGCAISLPVSAGDYGMLIVCERNIGSWRGTGNQGDPGDLGMHTLDGAVFYPTLRPDKALLQSADATNMVIGRDANTSARVIVKPSTVEVGAAAANFVAMADKLQTAFATFTTMLNSIFGAASTPLLTTAPGSPDVVYTALKTAVSALFVATTWPITTSAVASSNLKAED